MSVHLIYCLLQKPRILVSYRTHLITQPNWKDLWTCKDIWPTNLDLAR